MAAFLLTFSSNSDKLKFVSIVNKEYVLVLNSICVPIGVTTIRKALIALNSTSAGEIAAQALDLSYSNKPDGSLDFMNCAWYPTDWDDWVNLPIRDFDIRIHTPRIVIRAPIVIIAKNYSKIPHKRIKLSKRAVYDHYKGIDVWTGRKLSYNEASLEHMTPKSHKGEMSWKNIALSDKKLNAERGNIPIDKWRHKPKYKLSEPLSKPICTLITTIVRPEWEYFLIHKK